MIPTVSANGSPAFGQYKPAPDGGHEPWALQVIEIVDGRIAELTFFLETEQGVPALRLAAAARAVAHSGRTVGQAHERDELAQLGDALRRRTVQPWRRAPSCRRASASTVTASGSIPATSHSATSAALARAARRHAHRAPGGLSPDRAADGERDRPRFGAGHYRIDGTIAPNSSGERVAAYGQRTLEPHGGRIRERAPDSSR